MENQDHPALESKFWESPALSKRAASYPEEYEGRVPMRIRLLKSVATTFPISLLPTAKPGTFLAAEDIREAWTNSYGAVSGICKNGVKLGLVPSEFEVVEWYTPPTATT